MDQYLAVAVEIGERLLAEERRGDGSAPWAYWLDNVAAADPEKAAMYDPSLYPGVSGIVHFLLPLYRLTKDERFLQAATRACDWLWQSFDPASPGPPGLYLGQSGPALVLLELYETAGASVYLERACQQGRSVAEQTCEYLDLMNGPPGYGLLFQALFNTTGDRYWRDAARRCVDVMKEAAEPYGSGGVVWSVSSSPQWRWVTPGLAHGLAGVACYLHALARLDPESGAGALGAQADEALVQMAHERDGGLDWTHAIEPPGDAFLVQWCHGAPGVAIAFLNSPRPDALEIAKAAGRVTLAAGDNRNQASQCHGLCGNAETFIELFRRTGDESWLREARRFVDLAEEKHRLPGRGAGAFRTHDDDAMSSDLMTGIAGVGYTFLRLSDPKRVSYPIIGRWLPQP
ncbi:MAG: hypothetical protein LC772_08095 [Chloroflexi bacterium]|nr:hypothetical protein [Chloroflexota bacterium]